VPQVAKEIFQPFQFNRAGELAYTQDPAVVISMHMLEMIFTRPGERVMQPTYGIGAQLYMFEGNNQALQAQLVNAIRSQVGLWEAGVNLLSVSPLPSDMLNGELKVQVSFTVGASPTEHVITYNLNGQAVET
jgi:hypothetical protein